MGTYLLNFWYETKEKLYLCPLIYGLVMNDWRSLTHLTVIVVSVHWRHMTTGDTIKFSLTNRWRICYRLCWHPTFHEIKNEGTISQTKILHEETYLCCSKWREIITSWVVKANQSISKIFYSICWQPSFMHMMNFKCFFS